MKKFLIVPLAALVVLSLVAGILLFSYSSKYIGSKEAVRIALEDAGLSYSDIREADAEFEKTPYDAWYEVEFETHGTEYEYSIAADTGEILSSYNKPDR
ncbi:MAG: PepSY domain-containing protein [Oscillospiraceae bacterium]|nr:PepSY domain-containing protein [Oscillospiraceae bacterium]